MSRRHRGAWRGRVFGNVNMGSAWSLFPPPNTGRMGKGWGRARESKSRRAYPGVNERQKVGDAWGRPGPRRLKLLIAHIVYPFAFRRELSCPLAFLFSCFHESGRNFGGGGLVVIGIASLRILLGTALEARSTTPAAAPAFAPASPFCGWAVNA